MFSKMQSKDIDYRRLTVIFNKTIFYLGFFLLIYLSMKKLVSLFDIINKLNVPSPTQTLKIKIPNRKLLTLNKNPPNNPRRPHRHHPQVPPSSPRLSNIT